MHWDGPGDNATRGGCGCSGTTGATRRVRFPVGGFPVGGCKDRDAVKNTLRSALRFIGVRPAEL